MNHKPETRGGKREGAGRHTNASKGLATRHKLTVSLYVLPSQLAALDKARGVRTRSAFIASLIEGRLGAS